MHFERLTYRRPGRVLDGVGPMDVERFLPEMLTDSGAARQDAAEVGFRNARIFDGKIEGRSFLDIGSHHGDLCLEALRLGAARAVGVELIRENVLIARNRAEQAGLAAEYIHGDFERGEEPGNFDIVACLNVLPELFDPIHALRRMAAMARERLIIELPSRRRGWLSRFRAPEPVIDVPLAARMHEVAGCTFLPNAAAMAGILNQHMATFEPVQVFSSNAGKSFLVVATKRRIKHLTVVAGPSKAGKSTFKNRIIGDEAFRRSLGLPAEVTAQADANEVRRLPTGELAHVVLHYDFLRPFDRALGTYERDPAAELFRSAEQVSMFTLMTPKARLRAQLAAEKLKRKKQEVVPLRRDILYALYDTPDFLTTWYDRWFRFCETLDLKHTVVRNDGNYEFFDSRHWQRIHAENHGDGLKSA